MNLSTSLKTDKQSDSASSFWRKFLSWIKEDDRLSDTVQYDSINEQLDEAKYEFESYIDAYKCQVRTICKNLEKDLLNDVNTTKADLENAISIYKKKVVKMEEFVKEWEKHRNRSERQKKDIAEPILYRLKKHLGENPEEERLDYSTEKVDTLTESLGTKIAEILLNSSSEKENVLEELESVEDSIDRTKNSISSIAEIVGTESLGNIYSIHSQRSNPRPKAMILIGMSVIYFIANVVLFTIFPISFEKGIDDFLVSVFQKPLITSPLLYLLILAHRGYKKIVEDRDMYDYKKTTSLAYHSFASSDMVDDKLKIKLTDTLIDAIAVKRGPEASTTLPSNEDYNEIGK